VGVDPHHQREQPENRDEDPEQDDRRTGKRMRV